MMAGDWIKMRVDLADDPAVIGISAELGIEEDTVVGKLHRLWSWADRHTCDGTILLCPSRTQRDERNAPSVTVAWLERYIGVTGFARAMEKVGWLEVTDDGICFPDFEKHNGETAKKRALSAKRSQKHRHATVTQPSRTERDDSVTREEKRREEKSKKKNPPNPPFKPLDVELPHEGGSFASAWADFCQMRTEIRKPLKPTGVKLMLRKLAAMSESEAIAALEYSTAGQYQGIFTPDTKRSTHGESKKTRADRNREVAERWKAKPTTT